MVATDQSSSIRRRRSIEVVDYDPSWPRQFEEIQADVSSRLSGLVVEIHHIGSTAIPGLCAKPKIDVDIVLRSSLDIAEGIARLQASGTYTFHGDRYNDDMWVFTTGRGSHGQRLYLCAPEHQTHLRRILFRDYLRRHPEAATAYGVLKRRLALEAIDDWDYYTGSKGPFIAEIVQRAMEERGTPDL
jgi:GrpB-like predicted nucleotidyltransferase (UPF0157 family)